MDKQFCLWSSNALWVTRLMINWKCSSFYGGKTHFMNWACLEATQWKVNIISFCPNVLLDSGESRVTGVLQDAAAYEKTLKFGIIIISVTLSWCYKKWLSIIQQFFSYFQAGEMGRDPLNNMDRSNDKKLPNDDYRVIKKIACLFWTTKS